MCYAADMRPARCSSRCRRLVACGQPSCSSSDSWAALCRPPVPSHRLRSESSRWKAAGEGEGGGIGGEGCRRSSSSRPRSKSSCNFFIVTFFGNAHNKAFRIEELLRFLMSFRGEVDLLPLSFEELNQSTFCAKVVEEVLN